MKIKNTKNEDNNGTRIVIKCKSTKTIKRTSKTQKQNGNILAIKWQ